MSVYIRWIKCGAVSVEPDGVCGTNWRLKYCILTKIF